MARTRERETEKRLAQQIRESSLPVTSTYLRLPPRRSSRYMRASLRSLRQPECEHYQFYGDNLERHVFVSLDTLRSGNSVADARELIATSRAKALKLHTVRGIARTLSTVLSQLKRTKSSPQCRAQMSRYLRRRDEPEPQIQRLTGAEAAHAEQLTAVGRHRLGRPISRCPAQPAACVQANAAEGGDRQIRIHDLHHTFFRPCCCSKVSRSST